MCQFRHHVPYRRDCRKIVHFRYPKNAFFALLFKRLELGQNARTVYQNARLTVKIFRKIRPRGSVRHVKQFVRKQLFSIFQFLFECRHFIFVSSYADDSAPVSQYHQFCDFSAESARCARQNNGSFVQIVLHIFLFSPCPPNLRSALSVLFVL